MSYLALYRKYRPKNFDEVVGQQETTDILKNQIQSRKFGHAYLFSGIRGTGKTSTAKIMAKAVNCLEPIDGNPCNVCDNCRAINQDQFMDVIEIDAASNNGVDNVRELRENAKYLPSKGTHKVYIIDEVQMLSSGAFNALLKTLEEPSEHVVFILATTEPEKIPVTILSRCQRYDFKRIVLSEMIDLMRRILADLSYTFDEEALDLIALKSDGAMRDALSLLEKVVSKTEGHISRELTSEVLGMVEFVVLSRLFSALMNQDVEQAIRSTETMVDSGISVSHILEQMLMFIRGMMLSKVFGAPSEIIALPVQLQQELIREFSGIALSQFSQMIEIINETLSKLRYAAAPRLSLELAVISMSLLFDTAAPVMKPTQPSEEKVAIAPQTTEKVAIPPQPAAMERPKVDAPKGESDAAVIQEDVSVSAIEPKEIPSGGSVLKQWDQVLEQVKQERKIAHAFLIEGNPVSEDRGKVVIAFRPEYNFHMENVMVPENRQLIERVILGVTGKRFAIEAVAASMNEKKNPEEPSKVDKVKAFLGNEYQDILTIK